ncbi:MAG: AraC family transcriptional regulator [Clostridia bacterium]|nr:AraC family transcriptional regulator [Clostridia bacterium]
MKQDKRPDVLPDAGSGQYESIPFSDDLFPIRINRDSVLTAQSGHAPITWHEQLEILIILEGQGVCVCDCRRIPCSTGDIILINPCEPHTVECDAGRLRYHCLMIDPSLYDRRDDICSIRYISAVTDRSVQFRSSIGDNARIRALLEDILDESLEQRTGYEMAIKGDILKLFAELFRNEPADEMHVRKPYEVDQLSPAMRYIAAHYASDITLADLAGVCCMNPSYFCRRFHALTGRTAMSYLNEYRLSKAQTLLVTTSRSVSEIAQTVGFSDSSYFTRVFRSVYGVSPSEARKKSGKKE